MHIILLQQLRPSTFVIVGLFGLSCEVQIVQYQSQARSKTGRPQVPPAAHSCVARLSGVSPRLKIRDIFEAITVTAVRDESVWG